ncbi:MAG TPA: hypothetical protein VJR89_39620, partial [Polyangiales bacterium]|nr:hypothetical protein [Polyangiales bacterium]
MTAPGSRSTTEGSSNVGGHGISIEVDDLRAAIQRAEQPIWQTQRGDGAWDSPGDMGSITTAQAVITLHYMGRLDPDDAREATRFLRGQQKADGSFVLYPGAASGDLGATACAWAALQLSASAENSAATERARAYIDAHGGLDAVVTAMEVGDFSAMYLALVRHVDPQKLPCPNVTPLLVPQLLRFMQTRFHSGIFLSAFAFAVLVPRLRGERPHPA